MSRPRVAARRGLRLTVLLALVVGTTAASSTLGTLAEAHIDYCGHRSHYDLRHPHFRMEFVSEFDRPGGRHYHRVLFHRQLLGVEDWTTVVRCDHDG